MEQSRPVGCGREDEQEKYIFYLGCYFQCYLLKHQASDCSQLLLLVDESLLACWEKNHPTALGFSSQILLLKQKDP